MTMPVMCARCRTARARLTAYWGPALCRPCARTVAELLDQNDAWPPVPWTDADQELVP
jgi:hypothetical protein